MISDTKQLDLLYEKADSIDRQLLMNYSAVNDNLIFTKYLVEERGMDIHSDNDYVFNTSCSRRYKDITKYVISLTNGYRYVNKALIEYAHSGDIDFVKDMIEMGGDVASNNNEAIIWAAGFGHIEMVKYLLKNGAILNKHRAIELARQNKHKEMISFLEALTT